MVGNCRANELVAINRSLVPNSGFVRTTTAGVQWPDINCHSNIQTVSANAPGRQRHRRHPTAEPAGRRRGHSGSKPGVSASESGTIVSHHDTVGTVDCVRGTA